MESYKIAYLQKLIKRYKLDLSGLTVFTEFATGNYLYTGIAAAMAGAKKVYMYNGQMELFAMRGLRPDFPSIEVANNRYAETICNADIITNSGFVRPITQNDISKMKKTAVVALMMKADQVRLEDVNIQELQKAHIVPIATDEAKIGLLGSMGWKIIKACFESGLSVWRDKYILMASAGFVRDELECFFADTDIDCQTWPDTSEKRLATADAIIVAEYGLKCPQIGPSGLIKIQHIKEINPNIKIIYISGNVDVHELNLAGIFVFPHVQPNLGHTALSGDYLSYKVTFELNIASLKAAEIAARARLDGKKPSVAERLAVLNGPAEFINRRNDNGGN